MTRQPDVWGWTKTDLISLSYHILLEWVGSGWVGLGSADFTNRDSFRPFSFQVAKSFTRMVDGFFFPDEPLELLIKKTFRSVPSIIGVNNHECGFLLPMVRILTLLPAAPSTEGPGFAPTAGRSHGWHTRCEGWNPSTEHRAAVLPLSEGR